MNCREFENRWNDLLDARSAPREGLESSLEAHASGCEPCRAISSRYRLLQQATATLRPPSPSAESLARLLEWKGASARPNFGRDCPRGILRRRASMATAAAVFGLCWLGGSYRPLGDSMESIAPDPRSPVVSGRSLDEALAEATEATLDLAREASASASRFGREVLKFGRRSAEVSPVLGESEPSTVAAEEPLATSPGMLSTVRNRVGAGVRPISGSARSAFGFLLGPTSEPSQPSHESHDTL